MNKIRNMIAIWVGKAAITVSRLLGKKGSSKPGQIALAIAPNILRSLAAQVRKEIIVVCGTNGKTTTNNLLYHLIRAQGYEAVCNLVGANMLYGVCCAFVAKAGLFGKLRADYACIEVDEASAVKVFDHFQPDKLILTNLFRDQLDRYGEIDITIDYLRRALEKSPETQLILNGDDPLAAQFGFDTNRKCYFAGVEQDVGISLNETKEGRFCVRCGSPLHYDYYHYSQLGSYRCTGCSFARPALDFKATDVHLTDGLQFRLDFDSRYLKIDVNYRGFYNIYNIMLSVAGSYLATGDTVHVDSVLEAYKPQIGRMEEFCIGGKRVVLNLSKNPAGFNQAISTVVSDPRKKDIMIAINDNAQDGRDISWIWDVDFERLADANAQSLTAAGIRADDLAVRLKYALLGPAEKLPGLEAAAKHTVAQAGEICYILVNYTAIFKMQDILKDMESKEGGAPECIN